MELNNLELTLEVVYRDEHMLQIELIASNGRYAGTTTIYTQPDGNDLIEFGEKLRGFPVEIGQTIRQEFGFTQSELDEYMILNPGMKADKHYAGLNFLCVDKNGHAAVDITLREENLDGREEARGKASFEMRFDPASLDRFVEELIAIGERKEGKATLQGNLDNSNTY